MKRRKIVLNVYYLKFNAGYSNSNLFLKSCDNIKIPYIVNYFLKYMYALTAHVLKGGTSRFVHIEKFSLNFSNLSFVICVNLLHPYPSLFLYGLLLPVSLWCFSILFNCYFQISYHLKVILYVAKITQNTVELLLRMVCATFTSLVMCGD